MLVCQYVILCEILGQPIAPERRRRIRRSLELQVRSDGGWGMHPDSASWLFHTTLAYVALRLLGAAADDPLAAGALRWIRGHGGVVPIPTWGRVWLAMLGMYPWQGVQPILPEMWLLPDATPVHPRRLYNHMRLIYLGLSYVYGVRLTAPDSPRLAAIRDELYPEGYARVRFAAHRDEIAATDLYEAPGAGLRVAFAGMRALDRLTPGLLRRRALARAMEHIRFEFASTDHVCLSPVNGLLFCLALHHSDPRHPELPRALQGLEYWVWEDDEEGMRICGARSDIWDTSFVLQALAEGPALPDARAIASAAAAWLPRAQLRADIPDGAAHYREPADGGWGFADERHPWPVSDCTAEALEALLHAIATWSKGQAYRSSASAPRSASSWADRTTTAASAPTSRGAAAWCCATSTRRRSTATACSSTRTASAPRAACAGWRSPARPSASASARRCRSSSTARSSAGSPSCCGPSTPTAAGPGFGG